MPDSWTLDTPDGSYTLNQTFSAPKYQPGSVSGPGALRRDDRTTYQRSGDGLATPGPLTLIGRVWRDDQDQALMLQELEAIRDAVATCTTVTRSNNAGEYVYDSLAGGGTPEITPDGLGGWLVTVELWPGRATPTWTPAAGLGAPIWHSETRWSAPTGLNWETGWRFTIGVTPVTAGAVMLYAESGGTETVNLWRVSDQALLRSADVTSDGGWGEALIEPLLLEPGQDYILSRFAPSGTPVSNTSPSRVVPTGTTSRPVVRDPGITDVGTFYNNNTLSGGYPETSGSGMSGVNFRAVEPSGGHRFIRLNVQGVNGGDRVRINRLKYRAVIGGADIATEGSPFESSTNGNSVTGFSQQLYVANSNDWLAAAGLPAWAALDFGGNNKKTIAEYEITSRTQTNRAPTDWILEGSNDLITWEPIHTVTNETGWSANETRIFTV